MLTHPEKQIHKFLKQKNQSANTNKTANNIIEQV
jgi:hypothetical protein